ncbi:MAG TPA: hypothetical protein VFY29_06785 [Terriglobia bacterium]|nr:hypothetical protein [Terriglobia bacterium]
MKSGNFLFSGLAFLIFVTACQSTSPTPPVSVAPSGPWPTPGVSIVSIDAFPVMKPGAPGTWDDTDVLNPSVLEFGGSLLNHYSGYSHGLWSTGTAVSRDNGSTWTRKGSPFLVSPPLSETVRYPIAANGSSTVLSGQIYHLYERNRSDSNGDVSIWLATSRDGITWETSPGEVFAPSGVAGAFDETQVADPYVITVGDSLYMFYTGVPRGAFKVLIGLATSRDGIHWVRKAGPLINQGRPGYFDENIQGEPAVINTGPWWYMLYVGDTNTGFRSLGWASSADGIRWTRQSTTDSIVPQDRRQAWFANMMIDPDFSRQAPNPDGTYTVYFGGGVRPGNQLISGAIGRMTVRLK